MLVTAALLLKWSFSMCSQQLVLGYDDDKENNGIILTGDVLHL